MGNQRSSRWTRLRGLRDWWAVIAIVPLLLACGTYTTLKPLPMATLPPQVAPFAVVTLGAGELQSRAGHDGTLLWQQPVETTNGGSGGDTLLAAAGLIYSRAQGGSTVEAFSAATGTPVWQLSGCPGYDNTLTVARGLLFVTCGADMPIAPATIPGDTLYALDAATGAVRWRVRGEHFRLVAGDVVITQTPLGLAARVLGTGSLRWSHALALAAQQPPVPAYPREPGFDIAITAANGLLYLVPDGQRVVALSAAEGSLRWQSVPVGEMLPPLPYPNPYRTTPQYLVAAATAQSVVVRAQPGTGTPDDTTVSEILALNATTGRVRWHVENTDYGSILSSQVGGDGAIFVTGFLSGRATSQTTRRLDTDTGATLWSTPVFVERHPPTWDVAGTLYFGDGAQLIAIRAGDGTLIFDDQGVYPAALAANADVVAVADGYTLYLLAALDGKEIWKVNAPGDSRAPPLIVTMSG